MELLDNWIKSIRLSEEKEKKVRSVLKEIDCLIDSDSKEPITIEKKKRILENLYQGLIVPQRLSDGRFLLNEQFDNKYYLILIKDALELLNCNQE